MPHSAKHKLQDNQMGPGSQNCSVTLPLSRAGKGHPKDWLNLAFLLAAGETNQADAGSGGAPQGYPTVLLPWCQGLAPCLWVQQVSALGLLCTMKWCWSALEQPQPCQCPIKEAAVWVLATVIKQLYLIFLSFEVLVLFFFSYSACLTGLCGWGEQA